MVYKSRPDASDAQLAWDRFTVLHECQPLEMEFLSGAIWRFRYLNSSDAPVDVQLEAPALEAVGEPDPAKLRQIERTWERARRNRARLGGRGWLVDSLFGLATVALASVITSLYEMWNVPARPEVRRALFFSVLAFVILIAQHSARWRGKADLPVWCGDLIIALLSLGMLELLVTHP